MRRKKQEFNLIKEETWGKALKLAEHRDDIPCSEPKIFEGGDAWFQCQAKETETKEDETVAKLL